MLLFIDIIFIDVIIVYNYHYLFKVFKFITVFNLFILVCIQKLQNIRENRKYFSTFREEPNSPPSLCMHLFVNLQL